MEKKNYPYIGITGFMSSEEVELTLGAFRKARPLIKNGLGGVVFRGDNDRILMVGVLASLKTLYGKTNKWPNRYPRVDEIKDIFCCSPSHVLNLIHYNTRHVETLFPQLVALTEIAGVNMNGFQLNITWPDPEQIEAYKMRYPNKIIVLQVGRKALDMTDGVVLVFKDYLSDYKGIIDYVLFDPSGGKGESFDGGEMLNYLWAAKDVFSEGVGLGIAGGLSSKTLDILRPAVEEFPDISIDAEGRLRNENDHLDLKEAEEYIKKAFEVL